MLEKARITIQTASESLVAWVNIGQSVWDALQQAGLWPGGDCGGRGICGKCKLRVEGNTGPLSNEEMQHLTNEEKAFGYRLACHCRVEGEVRILVPDQRIGNYKSGLLMYERYPGILPAVKIIDTNVPRFEREAPIPLLERMQWAFKDFKVDISSPNLNNLASLDKGDGFYVTGGVVDSKVLRIVPRGEAQFCGVALDIGTTSLSGMLVNLITGELLNTSAISNSQLAVGRDVLSRITYVVENNEGLENLQNLVIEDIRTLIMDLVSDQYSSLEDILEMTVVGNPVMLHLFLGLDPRGLGSTPYVGLFNSAVSLQAKGLGLPINEKGRITVLPQIGSFLGADVISCLLALDFSEADNFLLMDIGTNGELVLKTQKQLMACSVAAGSAFEGGGISSGMVAGMGAIDRFWLDNGEIRYTVVGQEEPQGICGSGLVDLMAVLLDLGVLDETGLIDPTQFPGEYRESSNGIELVIAGADRTSRPVVFNQQDVRQLQLAKGALRAGIDILMKETGTVPSEVEEIYMAGVFGNHLNPDSLFRIGMLPDFEPRRVKNIGNAAARGAIMALVLLPARKKAEKLARRIRAIDLASRDDFSQVFLDSLDLKKA